jgi:hypothetical protein
MKKKSLIFLMIFGVSFVILSLVCAQQGTQELRRGVVSIERVEELKEIQARHEDNIMGIPGVVGIGIGLTEDGADLAFIVYVEKLTSSVEVQVPNRIEGVPVRMIESGIFKAY